jgi:hypothetical protein
MDLVDAFERVLDEGVLDEVQLVRLCGDLTLDAVLALKEISRPRKWYEKWKWWARRDTLGKSEKSAVAKVFACAQLPKFRIIEVCEIIAAEQNEGDEDLQRLTGIMERMDFFVASEALRGESNLAIARGYLMLMLTMRTLSAQAVHCVVADLGPDDIKTWLMDLYGKDAIALKRDDSFLENDRLFGLFRRREEGQSICSAMYNNLEDCAPIWYVGIYSIWPMITERLLNILKCTSFASEDGTVHPYWDFETNVMCYAEGAYWWPNFIGSLSYIVWSLGSIVFLVFKIKATGPENRFNDVNMRKFGYFYQGFEPKFWYWEIGWKRLDILLVLTVTYTSLVPDVRAKVIIYVMLAGIALAAHTYNQPYDDRNHGLLDRGEMFALLVRFSTFATVALLLLVGANATITFVFMGTILLVNFLYMIFIGIHVVSEVTKGAFTPNIEDEDGDEEMQAKLAEAKKHMTRGRKWLLWLFGPTIVSFHRQRALAEKHAVHLVWQGPARNARFGKLPPPDNGCAQNCMLGFVRSIFSLGDDAEMSGISKGCADFWDYMMGMPSEVPSHGLDILLVLVLANKRILAEGIEPSGTNLIYHVERLLAEWMEKNADDAGRCRAEPAIPPRTVFVHGIDRAWSIASEDIIIFLVGFWRLPYAVALHAVHTIDVRFNQVVTHQVLPDEQVVLGAFQTAVNKQRIRVAEMGDALLAATGGIDTTSVWTDPLIQDWIGDRTPKASDNRSHDDALAAVELDLVGCGAGADEPGEGTVEGASQWYMPSWLQRMVTTPGDRSTSASSAA